jgi:hypothetical protein
MGSNVGVFWEGCWMERKGERVEDVCQLERDTAVDDFS